MVCDRPNPALGAAILLFLICPGSCRIIRFASRLLAIGCSRKRAHVIRRSFLNI
jgi:hypothetical protein